MADDAALAQMSGRISDDIARELTHDLDVAIRRGRYGEDVDPELFPDQTPDGEPARASVEAPAGQVDGAITVGQPAGDDPVQGVADGAGPQDLSDPVDSAADQAEGEADDAGFSDPADPQ